jgi:hypothetical protein
MPDPATPEIPPADTSFGAGWILFMMASGVAALYLAVTATEKLLHGSRAKSSV